MDWSTPDVPAKFRKLYDRARAGKAKAAIRLHCLICVGWELVEVDRCTATGCPLYPLRNLAAQAETEAADRAKRRERALKAGLRPPITPSADGHGDRKLASISNATGRIRGKSLPGSPSRLKTDSVSAMHEGAEAKELCIKGPRLVTMARRRTSKGYERRAEPCSIPSPKSL